MPRFARAALLFATTAALPLGMARADEGMWTFDAFPAARMKAAYGFAPPLILLAGSARLLPALDWVVGVD